MTFLVIVAGLLFLRFGGSVSAIQRDGWYLSLNASLQRRLPEQMSALAWLLSLFLPVVFVALLDRWLGNGLWGFLFALGIFLYSLGRGDLQQQIQVYSADLQREDLQAAFHAEAVFNRGHRESDATSWRELHEQTVAAIAYRYFEHFFAVIFWSLLAGPSGALLYRLSQVRLDLDMDEEVGPQSLAEHWLWLLEWLPVRLFGITMALVGDFVSAAKPWLKTVFSIRDTTEGLLGQYTTGALGVNQEDSEKVAEIKAVQSLFYRSLVCAVVLVALWVIF